MRILLALLAVVGLSCAAYAGDPIRSDFQKQKDRAEARRSHQSAGDANAMLLEHKYAKAHPRSAAWCAERAGYHYLLAHKRDEARKLATKALTLGPTSECAGKAHGVLARVAFEIGDYNGALAEYHAALLVYPGYGVAKTGIRATRAAMKRNPPLVR